MPASTDKIAAPERQVELFELIGSTLGGKYTLERLLGVGGMGGVFAARAPSGPSVAVKVLSVSDADARERIAGRFAREARAAASLDCRHIVRVIEAGSEAARPYLVMELLEGEDLGERLRRQGRLPIESALHVAAQVLVALRAAHDAGIVHRDLKPDNVFVVRGESDPLFCKLLDFGMSKLTPREGATLALALTKKGMAVGTPFYMAPEQARATPDVDGRADLWALGAILFECMTGRPPFVAPTQEQLLISICTTDAPEVRALRPEIPSPVAKLIKRALARDRADRFSSAAEMLSAIIEAAPAERGLLPNASGPYSAQSSQRMPTLAVAPLPHADASGPHGALRASHSGPHRAQPTRPAPPPPKSSHALLVVLALGALLLGIGVAVYVLALTHARH